MLCGTDGLAGQCQGKFKLEETTNYSLGLALNLLKILPVF